jgi:polygalacturonase
VKGTLLPLLFAPVLAAQPWCAVEQPPAGAIQAAIDRCAAKRGGVAYLPPGQYTSGPLWLKDNVELRLEAGAILSMSQNSADWPAGVPALINSNGAKNIAITGRGTIDGKAPYEYLPMRGLDGEIAAEIEIARKANVEI